MASAGCRRTIQRSDAAAPALRGSDRDRNAQHDRRRIQPKPKARETEHLRIHARKIVAENPSDHNTEPARRERHDERDHRDVACER